MLRRRYAVLGKELLQKEEEGFLLLHCRRLVQDRIIYLGKRRGDVALPKHCAGKMGQISLPCNLIGGLSHDIDINIQRPVIKMLPVERGAVMIVPGIEKYQVSGLQIIFFILAPKMAASAFHEADDIAFMEMVREFLDDSNQIVSLYFKIRVIIDMTLLLLV